MNNFDDWIGYKREVSDLVTARFFSEYKNTFGSILPQDNSLFPATHWCLSPEIFPAEELGADSHPKTGLFLPDLGLPRRMWAGGKVSFKAPFELGETVTRVSTITDIKFKEGNSGKLGFVTVEHDFVSNGISKVTDIQNIVYRAPSSPGIAAPTPKPAEAWDSVRSHELLPNSTLLFRYSAMTFNGHRIHYDRDYAIKVEGYEGLVVHGPIQATWLQILATQELGKIPASFSYRGVSPLICDRPVAVEAIWDEAVLKLRVRQLDTNVVTMTGEAK